jgi:Na+-transporting NADH:ubiquinone oxidoreductase subunit B
VPAFLQNDFGLDAMSNATPLAIMRDGAAEQLDFWQLFFGFRTGSMGETAVWLILAGALYYIITKTAQWRLIVSTLGSAAALHVIFFYTGLSQVVPHLALMSGSILYVSVFMATDPVSAPNKPLSQWVYGIIIGSVTVLVRTFAGFPEGTSFGILIGNTFASLLDELLPKAKPKKKKSKTQSIKPSDATAKKKEPTGTAAGGNS